LVDDLVMIAAAPSLPALVVSAGKAAQIRFLEFFAANIRNVHTRRAYGRAVANFLTWCEGRGVTSLAGVQPLHVAAYIEGLSQTRSAPTAKQHLAAIRHLFDWLVIGQVVPLNPAASVRGPSHSVRRGKTPVLDPSEARQLLDAIDITTPAGLRDRALIGLMVFSFARIGAALGMKVEDGYVQNRRLWVRLHEKGGKRHEMPCHHSLEEYLHAYIEGCGLGDDPKGALFRTIERGRGVLTTTPLPQANAYAMIRRRAAAAGIATKIGNHTFRATGRRISRMGGRWRTPRRWPTTPRRAQRSSMIAGATKSRLMRSSASEFSHGAFLHHFASFANR
jgi:site-specific recombinase XerD